MPKVHKTLTGPSRSYPTPKLYLSFLPIPLLLPTPIAIPSSSSSKLVNSVTHYIFIRPHRPNPVAGHPGDDEAGTLFEGRTIFTANLPVDVTERDLRILFAKWGVVESVELKQRGSDGNALEDAVRGLPVDADSDDDDEDEDQAGTSETTNPAQPTSEPRFTGTGQALPRSKRPRRRPQLPPSVPAAIPLPSLDPRSSPYGASGARSAYITFLDPISVSRAMSFSGNPITIPKYGENPSNPTGLEYYRRLHDSLRPSLSSVKEHADSAMARHDHLHSLLLSSRAKKQGAGALVDEDGFTVVVRSGKYGRTGGSGALGVGVARKAVKEDSTSVGKKKKGVGSGELADFYRFQKTDRKRGELASLRKKFEQDKQKVEEMKKSKRFKPY